MDVSQKCAEDSVLGAQTSICLEKKSCLQIDFSHKEE
jgi:hypothetical protein